MIIGISSKIGCGKTTLANLFLKVHSEYTKLSFAGILKKECSERFCYPDEWNYTEYGKQEIINDNRLPLKYMTIREILQWYGTDFCRVKDPDYWVKKMQKNALDVYMKEPLCGIPKIIIDDVRFINEAKWIQNMGGKVIRLNPYAEWKPGSFANHQSETDLDNYKEFNLILNPKFGRLKFCLPLIEELIQNAI